MSQDLRRTRTKRSEIVPSCAIALLLCLALAGACLNPIPDDFPQSTTESSGFDPGAPGAEREPAPPNADEPSVPDRSEPPPLFGGELPGNAEAPGGTGSAGDAGAGDAGASARSLSVERQADAGAPSPPP